MKKEQLKEKWYTFTRFYFKEGYIDYWNGDIMDNPNEASKSRMKLNANKNYYRLEGKTEWISEVGFHRGMKTSLLRLPVKYTAVEFWNKYKI